MAAGLVPDGAEDFLFTNADHRELVSAGAAAGLAAAFGAPIGGAAAAVPRGVGGAWGASWWGQLGGRSCARGRPPSWTCRQGRVRP